MEFNQNGYGASPDEVEYWSTHRSKISDLYKSEKHFFTSTIPKAESVLDIGCAAGGSLLFSRELKPNLSYYGIDISQELINIAKKRFQSERDVQFKHFNGEHIPVEDNSIDLVFSFGVFHHLGDWKKMALEALRVSKQFVLFDIRVWDQDSLVGSANSYQKIALSGKWDGKTIIQYNIQSFNEIFNFLNFLKANSISSRLFGYYAPPTELAITPAKKVLMLAVLLEKNQSNASIELRID